MSLKFHWMLPKGGEVVINGNQTPKEATLYRLEALSGYSDSKMTDIEGWQHFAVAAESAGIDSVLIPLNRFDPDPILVASALGFITKKLKYIIAFRSGLMQPPVLVQQINTLSQLIGGRVSLNTVAGSSKEEQRSYGDFLSHDERYDRAGEFLSVCNTLWQQKDKVDFKGKYYKIDNGKVYTPFTAQGIKAPEIFVSGHSSAAQKLAIEQGTCWLRVIDTPEKLAPKVAEFKAKGIDICLRLGIICRPTRAEAIKVIDNILACTLDEGIKARLPARDDSIMYSEAANAPKNTWLNETIWTGFAPFFGPVWTTLVGTPEQLTDAFLAYKRIGIKQFILSGWPEINEVNIFGKEVIPRVRLAEKLEFAE